MPKQKQYWNVKSSASNSKEVDVFIYGLIGSSWWGDESDTDAFSFVTEFKDLEKKYDRINIRINSPGGSIHEGLPVFNAIRQSKKDVHTYNDGIAYSMGAIILMAGKQVHVAKNSLTLLHSPMTFASGNAKIMRETADFLDTYGQSLMQSVMEKTGKSETEVKSRWFDYEDHLLTASQAKEEGIADVIEETEGKVPENIANLSFKEVINVYSEGKPERDSFMNTLIMQMKSVFNITTKPQKTDIIMENIEKLRSSLSLDPNATVDDILEMVNNLVSGKKTMEDKVSALEHDLKSVNAEKEQIQSELNNAQSALAETTRQFEALKAEDASAEATANKDKDRIPGDPEAVVYGHDKIADEFLK